MLRASLVDLICITYLMSEFTYAPRSLLTFSTTTFTPPYSHSRYAQNAPTGANSRSNSTWTAAVPTVPPPPAVPVQPPGPANATTPCPARSSDVATPATTAPSARAPMPPIRRDSCAPNPITASACLARPAAGGNGLPAPPPAKSTKAGRECACLPNSPVPCPP